MGSCSEGVPQIFFKMLGRANLNNIKPQFLPPFNDTTGFSGNVVVVAGTSYQMKQVLSFCYRERA